MTCVEAWRKVYGRNQSLVSDFEDTNMGYLLGDVGFNPRLSFPTILPFEHNPKRKGKLTIAAPRSQNPSQYFVHNMYSLEVMKIIISWSYNKIEERGSEHG